MGGALVTQDSLANHALQVTCQSEAVEVSSGQPPPVLALKRSWCQLFPVLGSVVVAGRRCTENFGEMEKPNMVSEGTLSPDGEEQRARCGRHHGVTSMGLGGNLPPYSLYVKSLMVPANSWA